MDNLKAALRYRRMGFSVIPCKADKRPIVKWTEFQRQKPTEEQIREWWGKYPYANIAIVTGEISGVDVVDCDTEESYHVMNEEFLSDTFQTPVVKTPKGYHIYFKHKPGLSNAVRAINGTDLRTTGGYVIAPPSKNGRGEYAWFSGLSPKDCGFSQMPDYLFTILSDNSISFKNSVHSSVPNSISSNNTSYITNCNDHANISNTGVTNSYKSYNELQILSEGSRDSDLFRLANHLVKGGMDDATIYKYLEFFAANCSPPFPERDVSIKIKSALARAEKREKNFAAEIKDYILVTDGYFSVTDCYNELQVVTKEQKAACRAELFRLKTAGIVEKSGDRNGVYRRIDDDCKPINWVDADENYLELYLPLGLSDIAGLLPGNIIILAGAKDSGKTAWLMNIAKENRHKYEVHYFNSEMGGSEFKKRAMNFDDITIEQWKTVNVYEKQSNFHDYIKPGNGKINIIDYLEAPDEVWKVGSWIQKIHSKLDGAICFIGLQKKRKSDLGRGAEFSMEKARLYLSMDYGSVKIISCKNFKPDSPIGNPRNYRCGYKLVGGAKIIKDQTRGWHKDED